MATAKYHREWYAKNKVKRQDSNRNRKIEIRKWFREFKSSLVCERCGFSHPAALQFHHKDQNQKSAALADAINSFGWGIDRILEETKKCEVLCANCHAIEHYKP